MMCTDDSMNLNDSPPSESVSPPEEPNMQDHILLWMELEKLRQEVQLLLRERTAERESLAREREAAQKRRKCARTPAIFLQGAGTALALAPICFVLLSFVRQFLNYLLCHILDLSVETVLLYGGAILIGGLLFFCSAPLAELLCSDEDDLDLDLEIDMED